MASVVPDQPREAVGENRSPGSYVQFGSGKRSLWNLAKYTRAMIESLLPKAISRSRPVFDEVILSAYDFALAASCF
jgi:hypothetical protein